MNSKTAAKVMLNGEKAESISIKSWIKKGDGSLCLTNAVFEVLTQAIR